MEQPTVKKKRGCWDRKTVSDVLKKAAAKKKMTNTLFDQLFVKVSESLSFPDCESLCLVVCQSLIIIDHRLQSLGNVIIDY